ncbi:hypothetical protein B566_EDAN007113, partial [Ephemera danica]
NIDDGSVIPSGYTIFRKDRESSAHGGVLTAVKSDIVSERVENLETSAEIIWTSVTTQNSKILVGTGYRSPNASDSVNNDMLTSLELARAVQMDYEHLILMGDFNLNIDWCAPCVARNTLASHFLCAFNDLFLTQLVSQATRIVGNVRSILDLVFCTAPDFVENLSIIPGVSDHCAIVFNFDCFPKRYKAPSRHVYNFKRVNWEKLSNSFRSNLPIDFSTFVDVDSAYELWFSKFFACLNSCVKKCSVKPRKFHPWITTDIVKHLKRKSRNKKAFWKYIKSKRVALSPQKLHIDGILIDDSEQICNAFNDNFASNFTVSQNNNCDIVPLNNMSLNLLKNVHMSLSRSNNVIKSEYELCGIPVSTKNNMKLLGVNISNDLKWNFHVDTVCNKANRLLGFIARSFKGGRAKMNKLLYVSLVRSVLTYGTPAWHPI